MATYKVLQGSLFPSVHNLHEIGWQATSGGAHFPFPDARYLDEIRTLSFMQAIMEKPEWYRKVTDASIWEKWKAEAMAADAKLRPEMLEYALKEVAYCASKRDHASGIEWTGVDLVWRSDSIVPSSLRTSFITAVDAYASTLPEKDYHPNSDDQVLNIVHPSLFCLVYNRTTDKQGNPIALPSDFPHSHSRQAAPFGPVSRWGPVQLANMWSDRFQWLPAEFLLDADKKEVKIASYINSLHPSSALYPLIANIFGHIVPIFNYVLSDLKHNTERQRFVRPRDYDWWGGNFEENMPDEMWKGKGDIEEWDDTWQELNDQWKDSIPLIPVPVPPFAPEEVYKNGPYRANDQDEALVDLWGHRLQVIVKIGSIELTPDKPTFEGGKWHVEGMANEKIVATCIYYYDTENIQGDKLDFRQAVDLDTLGFGQDDDRGATEIFGIGRDQPMVQSAGSVKTPSGRVLVFPNIYQHAIHPFSLADPTKPGHRKILVFFLVDPTKRITSTASVPPQDQRWHEVSMGELMEEKLPVELVNMVRGQMGSSMTLEEAKKYRLELMQERSFVKEVVTHGLFEREFNLCEH